MIGFKIMVDGKQDDPNAVRTKKIEVEYRQTLRRKKNTQTHTLMDCFVSKFD